MAGCGLSTADNKDIFSPSEAEVELGNLLSMKPLLFTLYSKKKSFQLLITEHKNVFSSWSKYDLCSSITLWVAEQHQTKQKVISV